MPKKDKNDSAVYRHLLRLDYEKVWDNYTDLNEVNEILAHSSKNNKGNAGFPDFIYVNEDKKLLIMAEVKSSISRHISSKGEKNPVKYAVDGIVHYLSFFLNENIRKGALKTYFEGWKIAGIAISGNIDDEYNHRISNYIILGNAIIEQKGMSDIPDEYDYLMLFDNIDEETIISNISASSKKINRWLRSVDSQKRPVLLSALMICLFEVKGVRNDFKFGYNAWGPGMIVDTIPKTVKRILLAEELPEEKINVLLAELAFMEHDQDLNRQDILKDILNELSETVIPLFEKKSNYDMIGKFYEEFLKYAGVANVKKGIVLTPRHITTLFTELIDIRTNDVFLDPACGTGSFLIAAMNKLISVIHDSGMADKENRIKNVKTRHLIGFEKNQTMYSLAISNMLFRGDGKSQIFKEDFFSEKADEALRELEKRGIRPTIGFVNPPYGGKDTKDNPTKKEIQFLAKMLDCVSRYGIMIAPLSTYFKEDAIRNNILQKHTLKYVINMPRDLFMPNAAANTAIAVFETHKPQKDQETVFFDLKDDGFVLSKSKGRTDVYNKWAKIKKDLLEKIRNPGQYVDGIQVVRTRIKDSDEWLIQAHAATDYSSMGEAAFSKTVKEYMIFIAKRDLDLLEKDIDEVTLLEILSDYYSEYFMENIKRNTGRVQTPAPKSCCRLDQVAWIELPMEEVFVIKKGKRLTKADIMPGQTNFIGAISGNNGIREKIAEDPLYEGNCITVNYNGSVGEAYYQTEPFWASDDVNILFLKDHELNKYIALFLITVIRQNKIHFDFGRKWNLEKMKKTLIRIPADEQHHIYWEFMEEYIRSLPAGKYI